MKSCVGCKHVEWVRTKAGKLHPSGEGQCKYPYKVPELPAAFCWISYRTGYGPTPSGGYVERKKEFKHDCPYWTDEDATPENGEKT